MRSIKTVILMLSVLTMFSACHKTTAIDAHFIIETGSTSDDITLNYLDDNNNSFTAIGSKIAAYQKCGSNIFIVQKPSKSKPYDEAIKYYIIDCNKDYSDEKAKPNSIDISRFNSQLKAECGTKALIEL